MIVPVPGRHAFGPPTAQYVVVTFVSPGGASIV